MTDIHTCSYHCERPACVKAQRDEMRDELERLREALLALRLAHEQNKYRDWEKGVPNFKDAEALADAALEVAK